MARSGFTVVRSIGWVLALLATLIPRPLRVPQAGYAASQAALTTASPLPTPTSWPAASALTSPLPPAPPPASALTLEAYVAPEGVAPGEMAALTVTLKDPMGSPREGLTVRVVFPEGVRLAGDAPPGGAADPSRRAWQATGLTLAPRGILSWTFALRAVGPVDAPATIAVEATDGAARATTTATLWIVQPGRARISPEAGGMLMAPDRRAWLLFPAGGAPVELQWQDVPTLPIPLP